ncbi:MAG: DUF1080 domain-containing protein [Planctomycetota bacterium]|nr:MAG: DUF1080 domain-containing protein [Planctomycetota bacterium]
MTLDRFSRRAAPRLARPFVSLALVAALACTGCASSADAGHGEGRSVARAEHGEPTPHSDHDEHGARPGPPVPGPAREPSPPQPNEPQGYSDTPLLPDGVWRVHDRDRPVPPVVAPGLHGGPPSDAVVLFDGDGLRAWEGGPWRLVDGAMEVNGSGDLSTRESFGDVQLHLEWMSPPVRSSGQGRGNSGVFLMGRYEVQLLDSWGNRTYADGQAAAMYGQQPPDVNAARAPGRWQSYDILFTAPRFEDQALVSPALVTVIHNGVLVHHERAYLGATSHQRVAQYTAHEPSAPIRLQDHGDPVRYRNIWVRRLGG